MYLWKYYNETPHIVQLICTNEHVEKRDPSSIAWAKSLQK
jgi:hypothetical protein